MIKQILFNILKIFLSALIAIITVSCSGSSDITPTSESLPAENPTAAASTAISDIPKPGIIFVTAETADTTLANQIEQIVSTFAVENNFTFERRTSLTSNDFPEQLSIVISLGPNPGLMEMAESAPNVKFLAIAESNIEPTNNLFTLNYPQGNPEYVGFLAGYTAAVITSDWRVGVLSVSETSDGKLFQESFRVGVIYFCGLCLQSYPPYYDYPLFVELPTNSSGEDWRNAANQLIASSVQTIFVSPGVGDDSLFQYLSQEGITIIASDTPPPELESSWAASLGIDLESELVRILLQILSNDIGSQIDFFPDIIFSNPAILSTGKLNDIKIVQQDLFDSYIYPLFP